MLHNYIYQKQSYKNTIDCLKERKTAVWGTEDTNSWTCFRRQSITTVWLSDIPQALSDPYLHSRAEGRLWFSILNLFVSHCPHSKFTFKAFRSFTYPVRCAVSASATVKWGMTPVYFLLPCVQPRTGSSPRTRVQPGLTMAANWTRPSGWMSERSITKHKAQKRGKQISPSSLLNL